VTFYMLATITIKWPATQDYHLEPEEKIPSLIINSALSQIKNYALQRARASFEEMFSLCSRTFVIFMVGKIIRVNRLWCKTFFLREWFIKIMLSLLQHAGAFNYFPRLCLVALKERFVILSFVLDFDVNA
jgi:hypothetical protein